MQLNDSERDRLQALENAATKFIAKCDSGRARSSETYNELRQALAIGQQHGTTRVAPEHKG